MTVRLIRHQENVMKFYTVHTTDWHGTKEAGTNKY